MIQEKKKNDKKKQKEIKKIKYTLITIQNKQKI